MARSEGLVAIARLVAGRSAMDTQSGCVCAGGYGSRCRLQSSTHSGYVGVCSCFRTLGTAAAGVESDLVQGYVGIAFRVALASVACRCSFGSHANLGGISRRQQRRPASLVSGAWVRGQARTVVWIGAAGSRRSNHDQACREVVFVAGSSASRRSVVREHAPVASSFQLIFDDRAVALGGRCCAGGYPHACSL